MKAIGRFLLFFIYFAEMTLSVDGFSEENKETFLMYLLNEHNLFRMNLQLPEISRTIFMDNKAEAALISKMLHDESIDIENYGVNYYLDEYKYNIKLTPELATSIFTGWSEHDHTKVDSTHSTYYKGDGKEPILWSGTEHIGLAIAENDGYYAIIVLYSPRYNTRTQEQSESNDSDNGGASTS